MILNLPFVIHSHLIIVLSKQHWVWKASSFAWYNEATRLYFPSAERKSSGSNFANTATKLLHVSTAPICAYTSESCSGLRSGPRRLTAAALHTAEEWCCFDVKEERVTEGQMETAGKNSPLPTRSWRPSLPQITNYLQALQNKPENNFPEVQERGKPLLNLSVRSRKTKACVYRTDKHRRTRSPCQTKT